MKVLLICLILLLPQIANAQILTTSWYSIESLKAEGTYKYSKGVMANGEIFSNGLTCATRDYALGDWLLVRDIVCGRSVIVRVTDRIGKRFKGKRIDLSQYAFSQISDCRKGIIQVEVKVLK